MKYRDLIQFEQIESVVQLLDADRPDGSRKNQSDNCKDDRPGNETSTSLRFGASRAILCPLKCPSSVGCGQLTTAPQRCRDENDEAKGQEPVMRRNVHALPSSSLRMIIRTCRPRKH